MTDVFYAVQPLASGVDGPVSDASRIGPGFAAFAVMFGLAVATLLLVRSMVGHLRKVRYSPDPAADPALDAGATATPHTLNRHDEEAGDGVRHNDGGTDDGGGDGGGGGD